MASIEPQSRSQQTGHVLADGTEIFGSPALVVNGASKTFGAQRALAELDLEILPGEVHALLGANGSGKSTFVKLLAGYHRPDPGATAHVAGQEFELGSAPAARHAGLRFVHQNLGLIESMTVADNFRLETRGLAPTHRRTERDDAGRALESLGYDISPNAMVADLVESERTAIALARALDHTGDVPLLVLDEPTASLPGPEVERLFAAVRRIADNGTAILFISHHLEETFEIADRATVLRDGRKVATERVADLDHDRLVELMLGRQLVHTTSLHARLTDHTAPAAGRLIVRGLHGESVVDVDLDVAAGRILGVAGLTGSGREELAGLLGGRLPRAGSVLVDGEPVPPGDPKAAVDAGVCSVPADRAAQAVLPGASVRENLTLGNLKPFWRRGALNGAAETKESELWVERLDVRPAETEKLATELSGGNQQKVIIARWLRVTPAVLVLDEPTQGVDIGSKADIHRLVEEAAADGCAVVVCSTDDEELARLATEVVVIRRGRVAVRLTGDEITAERIEQEQLRPAEPLTGSAAGATPSTNDRRSN
jgi:ribose transport system ATP-binding protein